MEWLKKAAFLVCSLTPSSLRARDSATSRGRAFLSFYLFIFLISPSLQSTTVLYCSLDSTLVLGGSIEWTVTLSISTVETPSSHPSHV